jgi:hypothetical protein
MWRSDRQIVVIFGVGRLVEKSFEVLETASCEQ